MEIKIEFKTEKELKEQKKKPKVIKSLADLRKLLEEENPAFSYGGVEFGALPKEETDIPNDATEDRNEGEQEETPDDKAEQEDAETRVKNSKHPTVVGRMMK